MSIGDVQREYNLSIGKAFEKVAWDSVQELIPLIGEKYEEIFHKAVREFYGDYSPKIYTRNYSLYDAVYIDYDETNMSVTYTGDPENVTPFRNGGGTVFELSFLNGYHGGASSGDYTSYAHSDSDDSGFTVYKTPHPNPGTPYWRRPHPWYTQWGRPAAHSEAPADVFMEKKQEYLHGEMLRTFKEILYGHLGL